jgi:hypothetical protein
MRASGPHRAVREAVLRLAKLSVITAKINMARKELSRNRTKNFTQSSYWESKQPDDFAAKIVLTSTMAWPESAHDLKVNKA